MRESSELSEQALIRRKFLGLLAASPFLAAPALASAGESSPVRFRFASSDGLLIECVRWKSAGPARAVIQIAHGMGEHMGRYCGLAESLAAAGFAVYGNDHRGHGRTAGSPAAFGDFGRGGFELLVEDMVRLSRIAAEENPGRPLLLLGHSIGSFAAQRYVLDHSGELDGLILSGTGALDTLARAARAAWGRNILNAPFEPARTPFDWLSRDPAVVDAFMADPLCFGSLKTGAYLSLFAAAQALSDPSRLGRIRSDLPVYLFSGSQDPVGQQLVGVRLLIRRYHEAGLRRVDYDFYDGGRHEMLNEVNRDQVRARLLDWLTHSCPLTHL
jgi:alpha-beta hydrolase superfamily lysophospholipase